MSLRLCIGIGGKETKRDRRARRGRMVAACYLSPPFSLFLLLLLSSIVYLLDYSFVFSHALLFFFLQTRFLTNSIAKNRTIVIVSRISKVEKKENY